MRRLMLIVLLGLAACSDDDGSSDGGDALAACDPLVGMEQPIALGEVLAAGRDADGVVYVLEDPGEDELRVFVSDGTALQRHRVTGAGEGSLPGITFYDVGVEADPPFKLYLELPDGAEPSFSKIATLDERNSPDAAAVGEPLELLSEADLADFDLKNLPPDVTAEYFGELEDGRRVLVTRPEDDWSYEDFRVFLGASERMLEREVDSVLRGRDGGSTTIELTLDGEPATLSFPVTSANGTFEPGPWTLEQGAERLAIERLDAEPTAIDDLAFFCR